MKRIPRCILFQNFLFSTVVAFYCKEYLDHILLTALINSLHIYSDKFSSFEVNSVVLQCLIPLLLIRLMNTAEICCLEINLVR
jgi:hypothetical protein